MEHSVPPTRSQDKFPTGLLFYLTNNGISYNPKIAERYRELQQEIGLEHPPPRDDTTNLEQIIKFVWEICEKDEPLKKKILNPSARRGLFSKRELHQDDFLFKDLIWRSYGLKLRELTSQKPHLYNDLYNDLAVTEKKKKLLEYVLDSIREDPFLLFDFQNLLSINNNLIGYKDEQKKKIYQDTKISLENELNRLNTENSLFLRKVDLFALLSYLLDSYEKKCEKYNQFNISAQINNRNLIASFNRQFFKNTFNDFDKYQSINGSEVCIFNYGKYSHASFLHSAHKDIHYLVIKSTDAQDFDPVGIAILMQPSKGYVINGDGAPTDLPFMPQYLIVEGVLTNFAIGNGWTDATKNATYDFIWGAIKKFALTQKCNKIFVNTTHSGNQNEVEEFNAYVAEFEREETGQSIDFKLEQDKKTGIKKFSLKKPNLCYTPDSQSWFSHYFNFEEYFAMIHNISNIKKHKKKGELLYHGEQFADTFFMNHNLGLNSTPFVPLKGYAQGFEVAIK